MTPLQFIKGVKAHWHPARLARNICFLMDNEIPDVLYQLKDEAVEDAVYEFDEDKLILPRLQIASAEETIDLLQREPKSFSRFGDGEIAIMEGRNGVFQTYDPRLAAKMKAILNTGRDDLYVGLNRSYFQSPFRYAERNHKYYRIHGTTLRRFFLRECDQSVRYLDASCFGAYFRFGAEFDYEGHYERILRLFEDKDLVVVAGQGVLEQLEFDVFERAASKRVIHGPKRNAFDEYDRLVEEVCAQSSKDTLVCLILGMTATAMAADLTDRGLVAWDIGHVAKDYDVYKRQVEKTQENMDAFWRD